METRLKLFFFFFFYDTMINYYLINRNFNNLINILTICRC